MGIGRLSKVYLDVSDLKLSGAFWAELLGLNPSAPRQDPMGGWFLDLRADDGSLIFVLQKVPEQHTVKNRMHVDIDVDDLPKAIAETERAGGRLVRSMSSGFAVMADPDGNEFCLIPPD